MLTRLCLALFGAFAIMAALVGQAEARVHGAGYKSGAGSVSARNIGSRKAGYRKAGTRKAGYRKAGYRKAGLRKAGYRKAGAYRTSKARGRSYGAASTSRACLTSSVRAVLARVEAQFGTVNIVSTCRPGARIAGTGKISKHASGQAVDFTAPGGKKAEVVRWLIANHKSGGTMTYPMMNHIHIDVGYRFVSLAGRRVRRG